jgi:hypothetical protein
MQLFLASQQFQIIGFTDLMPLLTVAYSPFGEMGAAPLGKN